MEESLPRKVSFSELRLRDTVAYTSDYGTSGGTVVGLSDERAEIESLNRDDGIPSTFYGEIFLLSRDTRLTEAPIGSVIRDVEIDDYEEMSADNLVKLGDGVWATFRDGRVLVVTEDQILNYF